MAPMTGVPQGTTLSMTNMKDVANERAINLFGNLESNMDKSELNSVRLASNFYLTLKNHE